MGYLRVIESNTTWVCPKTATYKIICVASGNSNGVLGNPTSFGTYCTAFGTWNAVVSGYTLSDYAVPANNSSYSGYMTPYGYGCGITNSGALGGGTGRLKVAIHDIEKDTNVICTVGEAAIYMSGDTQISSLPGVIVIQEIGEVSQDSTTDVDETEQFTINLYRYGDLYQTLKVKKGSPLVLPCLPIYDQQDEYTGDVEHVGYTLSAGGSKVYNANQVIYPVTDMDLYAGYSYKYKSTASGGGVVGYPGQCYYTFNANPNGNISSDACAYIVINGTKIKCTSSGSIPVNTGDVVSTYTTGSGLSIYISSIPAVIIKDWRTSL